MYDLTTDEGVEAFNNRVPVNSDGTPYVEAEDASFMKAIANFKWFKLLIPAEDAFEKLDAKFSKLMRSLAPEPN